MFYKLGVQFILKDAVRAPKGALVHYEMNHLSNSDSVRITERTRSQGSFFGFWSLPTFGIVYTSCNHRTEPETHHFQEICHVTDFLLRPEPYYLSV